MGDCKENQACQQNWKIPIKTNGACSFTGIYQYRIKLKCNSLFQGNCPLGSSGEFAQIQIDVNSEEFCTAVNLDIKLKGSLKSYEDNQYTTPKSAFLQNQIGYFQAVLSSDQATLLTSTIKRAQITYDNTTKVFYDNGIQSFGTATEYENDQGTSTTCGFNFRFSETNTPVPVDSSKPFSISAVVEVTYAANAGQASPQQTSLFEFEFNQLKSTENNKEENEVQDDKYDCSINLNGNKDSTIKSGSYKLSLSLLLTIISLLLGMIF